MNAEALRPQSLSGLFDAAFDLYKRHFALLALIVALLYLPMQIIMQGLAAVWLKPLAEQVAAGGNRPDIGAAFALIGGLFVTGVPSVGLPGLFALAALALASGPVCWTVAAIVEGRPVSLGRVYGATLGRFPALLGGWSLVAGMFVCVAFASLIVTEMIVGLVFTAVGATAASASGVAPELAVLVLVALIVVPYLVGCAVMARSLCLTTPLIVLEHSRIGKIAVRNGKLVGKKDFRRAWAALMFLPFVTYGLQFLILFSVEQAMRVLPLTPLLSFIAQAGLAGFVSFFFQPYWMIFLTLFYLDCRARREGYDIRLLANEADATEQAAA